MTIHEFPAGATLITGNTRLSRQLLREHGTARRQRGERLWEPPDILPRDAWLRRWWTECVYRDTDTPLLLDPQQERVLWEEAIARSPSSADLLSIPATAALASDAWSLMHAWEIPRAESAFAGLADAEAFFGWMAWVDKTLRANRWFTASQLPAGLLRKVAEKTASTRPIFYAGFDELTPADRRIFSALGALEFAPGPPAEGIAAIAGFEDNAEEIAHSAAWARATLEQSPSARIGVVVRGLAAMRPMVERAFDDVLHSGLDFRNASVQRAFHISAGPPVAEAPLIATALLILRLPMGLPLSEAGMLIRSPYLKLSGTASHPFVAASAIDAGWRKQGIAEVSSRTLEIESHLGTLTKGLAALPLRSSPSQWSIAFSRLLARAGWPGPRPLSPAEYQALDRWNRLLSDFSRLDLVLPTVDYPGAVARLARIAGECAFTPDGGSDAPVEIMDALEAAGSRFDALWVAGLHAGVWPLPSRPNPFVPLSLQRAAGAPQSSAEREWKYARQVTDRLLRSAPEVTFSYPRFLREEPLRPSPLIANLPPARGLPARSFTAVEAIHAAAPARLDRRLMGPAPALPMGAAQTGGMSVIANQAACPFRAFATFRLNARELDSPVPGLSAKERGTVAHIALELFWRELKTQARLIASPPGEIQTLLRSSIRAALDAYLKAPRSSSVQRFRILEEQRLLKVLTSWLDVERARPPFEVVETEQGKTADVGGLRLRIKADRVDRYLRDGRRALLDYKTSKKLSVKDWEDDRPDAPQLPLYSTLENGVASVMFAKLAAGDPRLIGLTEAGEDAGRHKPGAPLAQRIPEWKRVTDALGAAFREGDAAVNPKRLKQTCRTCELSPVCRVAELNRAWVDEDDTDENDG